MVIFKIDIMRDRYLKCLNVYNKKERKELGNLE